MCSGTIAPARNAATPPHLINAIIDDETGEVHLPAIVDEDTVEINGIINPVTGQKREYRHLIKDAKIKAELIG